MKKSTGVFLGLSLIANLAGAQNTIVYTSNGKGKTRLEVPTNNNEVPSVFVNSNAGVIAFGEAAKIIADDMQEKKQQAPSHIALRKQALWSENQYIGSWTEVAPRIFITAAHVLNQLTLQDLETSLEKLNFSSKAQILHPYSEGKFLDIAIISDLRRDKVQQVLKSLMGSSTVIAGDKFSLTHLASLDSKLVEQESQGILSLSQDEKNLYLPTGLDSFLTWGSSGSVVISKREDENRFAGVVQCVVKTKAASSQEASFRSYFRVISSSQLLSAELIPSSLEDLSNRMSQYELKEKCGPVSGKDGGG